MKNEIHDSSILMKRLVRILDESIPKPVTILVGSPLTMPRGSSPGVPSVSEMIQLIREELGPESASLGDLDRLPSTEAYQTAFRTLQAVAGQDKVNKVIRDAVLRALRRGSGVPEQIHDKWCELVQYDRDCWYLSPGVKALGEILARYPSTYGRVVLTTNFDPLIGHAPASITRGMSDSERPGHSEMALKQSLVWLIELLLRYRSSAPDSTDRISLGWRAVR